MVPLTPQVRSRTVQVDVEAAVQPAAGSTGTCADTDSTGGTTGAAGSTNARIGAATAAATLALVGVAFVGIVWFSPPLWARAVWALVTVASAGWFVACGHAGSRTAPRTTRALDQPHDALVVAVPATPATSATAPGTADADADDKDIDAQDDVVQALVVASYALQMGDNGRARVAVDGALRRCRATLDALLRERAGRGGSRGHVRSQAAGTGTGRRPSSTATSGQRAGGHHAGTPSRRNGDSRHERHTSATRPTHHR